MKAVGLVTEYNPFHNGHLYHLNKAMELTGADISVAVMSGDFVQRGEPAVLDKYTRASGYRRFEGSCQSVSIPVIRRTETACGNRKSFSFRSADSSV